MFSWGRVGTLEAFVQVGLVTLEASSHRGTFGAPECIDNVSKDFHTSIFCSALFSSTTLEVFKAMPEEVCLLLPQA